jgi:DNA gyrase subunit B
MSDNGMCKAEVAFTYDMAAVTDAEDIDSYANFTPTTDGGTHVDGFLDGLCQFFRNYMNKFYLAEKSKLTVTNVDIKTGLKAVVFGACLNPVFAGQFKGILTSEEMRPFIKDATINTLDQWAKDKPGDLQKVAKYLKDVAEVRTKSNETKVKLTSNYETSALGELPKKFVKPSGRKNIEFFIVEGDSALGGLKNGRDHTRQGIFPIRGKLPNAFARNKTEILNNQEVSAIIRLVTGDKVYHKNFDVNQVKWDKIIILADADPDGSHISTLVLRLFLVFMPQVIQVGKLYKAIPPLYSVTIGKKKTYFATKLDFAKFIQQTFNKTHIVESIGKNGKKLTPNECVKFFYKNIDYAYNINILSNVFAVDPKLLELVLFNLADSISFETQRDVAVAGFAQASSAATEEETKALVNHSIAQSIGYTIAGLNFNKLKKSIEKEFRFMKVEKQNGTVVIQGEVNERYQYIFINNHFVTNCIDMIRSIMNNDTRYFKLDGNVASIYDIMNAFDNTMPSVKRYKGLGEMNSNEASEAVLSIENRTLIRYTLESAKEEINAIRYIDTNVSSLLSNITITRQDVE